MNVDFRRMNGLAVLAALAALTLGTVTTPVAGEQAESSRSAIADDEIQPAAEPGAAAQAEGQDPGAAEPGEETTRRKLRRAAEAKPESRAAERRAQRQVRGEREEEQPRGQADDGSVSLGVLVQTAPGAAGAVVRRVVPGSAAAEAGLRPDDIIVGVDDQAVRSVEDLARLIGEQEADSEFQLAVQRPVGRENLPVRLGQPMREDVEVQEQDQQAQDQARRPRAGRDESRRADRGDFSGPWLGIAVRAQDDQADGEEVREGIRVVAVLPGGPAQRAGLAAGDEIIRADGEKVASPEDFVARIRGKQAHESVEFVVRRNGEEKTVSATLGSGRDLVAAMQRRVLPARSPAAAEHEHQHPHAPQQAGDVECPICNVLAAQDRRATEQRQRIETLLTDLSEQVKQLREEMRQVRGERAQRSYRGEDQEREEDEDDDDEDDEDDEDEDDDDEDEDDEDR